MNTTGVNIVMVEDDAEVRRLVGALLEREGFGFQAAANGTELDGILASGAVDLIVLDVRRVDEVSRVALDMLRAAIDQLCAQQPD